MAGRIVAQDVEEVRERADLAEVVSGYTALKKAGRVVKGLCPFHQEKTPSFTIDPAKQVYHCFGCGAGGDVFTFLRQMEGLTFSEAAERLADRLGITLRHETTRDRGEGSPRRVLVAANGAAAEYFADLLNRSPEAAVARRHLQDRGFSSEDARTWRLGYSPAGRDALYRHLLGRKLTSRQIVESGLAMVSEAGEHRDRFRGRLMFPIGDVAGDVVGFGARTLTEEQPKYLNSPETPVYHKVRVLYGLDRAKTAMVKEGVAVITEGYTDVMALHKVGLTAAVATCGTALGEEHFALIKRFCDRVVLAFDSDAAGAIASERGFGIHSKVGLEVLVAPIPAGKDPADVALTEGREAMLLALDQAVPLMRFVLEAEVRRHRLDTPEGKGRAVRAAATLLAWEPNRVARGEHAFWLARRVGVAPEQVMLEIAEVREAGERGGAAPVPVRVPAPVRVEREALALLIDAPSLLRDVAADLAEDHFTLAGHRAIFRALAEAGHGAGPGSLMDLLPDDETRRLAAELALTPAVTEELSQVFSRLAEFKLLRKIDDLRSRLDRLDPGGDAALHDTLFEELMRLEEERRRFDDR